MAQFEVGDLVKKNRGVSCIGHQGWIKAVFTTGDPAQTGIYVTGLPDRGLTNVDSEGNPCPPRTYNGWNPSAWDKVVLTGEDRKCRLTAPRKEKA